MLAEERAMTISEICWKGDDRQLGRMINGAGTPTSDSRVCAIYAMQWYALANDVVGEG